MDSKDMVEVCVADIWRTVFWVCVLFWALLISGGVGIYLFFSCKG